MVVCGAEPLFIGPMRPALYPVLGKRCPAWWLYILWSLSDAEQQATIRRLEEGHVDWLLIVDDAVDDREELRLANTNPLLWRYIEEAFRLVPDARLPQAHLLFRRKDG